MHCPYPLSLFFLSTVVTVLMVVTRCSPLIPCRAEEGRASSEHSSTASRLAGVMLLSVDHPIYHHHELDELCIVPS
jgi:hypothetical protein